MPIETKPWDAAEYLKTPEDLAGYIELVLQEDKGSPEMLAHTIALAARARGGVARVAEESGIASADLSQAMEQRGAGSLKILRTLRDTYQMLAESPKVA